MNWIEERIAELKVVKKAQMESYLSDETSKAEKGDLSLSLVHLGMHINDLERVQTERASLFPTN